MNIMSIDAEYNQPSKKTIQIGVAIFEVSSGNLIESSRMYVNPLEPISDEISALTGITDKDVENGLSIVEAYDEIKKIHKKHKCFRNPLVWGSGANNDSQHIYNEYLEYKKIPQDKTFLQEENFMGFRVLDVKTIYQSVQIFKNSKHGGGLKESMSKLGLEFEGTSHDALNDAINTFKFWHHLMKEYYGNK